MKGFAPCRRPPLDGSGLAGFLAWPGWTDCFTEEKLQQSGVHFEGLEGGGRFILEGWRVLGCSFGVSWGHLGIIWGIRGSWEWFGGALDAKLGSFQVLLGPFLNSRGGLGVIFWTWVTFVENMAS